MVDDAPWIREAENDGYMADCESVECPCCGEECEEIYADQYGNVFACNKCLLKQDAWEWAEEQREAERDDT